MVPVGKLAEPAGRPPAASAAPSNCLAVAALIATCVTDKKIVDQVAARAAISEVISSE